MGAQLADKTLGIVGLGRIGQAVGARAKALQMRVLGFDPFLSTERIAELGFEPTANVAEMLPRVDYLTVHTPLTDETRNLVGVPQLTQLRDGVRLVNCARGGIYDEAALVEGLKSGKIAGAVGANIMLDDLDKLLEQRGHRFCRYADDCNIYVRSQRAGERVMSSVRRFIEGRLGLKINESKSKVDRPRNRKFLGFSEKPGTFQDARAGDHGTQQRMEHGAAYLRPSHLSTWLDAVLPPCGNAEGLSGARQLGSPPLAAVPMETMEAPTDPAS